MNMIKRIKMSWDWRKEKFKRNKTLKMLPDVKVSPQNIDSYIFCFLGEFGYELIAWLPFLKFIKEKYKLKIKTCSFHGASTLYNFSDKHIEFDFSIQKDCWGSIEDYCLLQRELNLNLENMIFPCNININREIHIGNCNWNIKDIHNIIPLNHYSLLNYSNINGKLPFETDKKIAVINNKSYFQFNGNILIKNFYNRDELLQIKKHLSKQGFYVVYNHYRDIHLNNNEKNSNLNDDDIFGFDNNSYDMNNFYHNIEDMNERNNMQISLFNIADIVFCVQGGNVYLPAICRKKILLLMREGAYIDYQELSRVYSVNLECFYEVKHMLNYV